MFKLLGSYLVLAIMLVGAMPFSSAFATQTTTAKQAVILDYETGQVLLNKSADSKMPTSSMSKVMTTYMVFDALKQGRIKMDSKFRVSEKAWKKGGSKMFVRADSRVTVEDLLRGVVIQSGNDATIVLAEGLEGSEDMFAKKMTAKAQELGMKNSNFTNASGWPDVNHYSTANDLALMARRIIEDFPEHYKMFGEKEFTYSDITQANRNPLLYKDIGADGLKTGHTEAGGYGLIGTAYKEGRRVLMVINGLDSEKARSNESVRLIEWALNNFKNTDLAKKGDTLTTARVAMGKADNVPLIIGQDIRATIPKFPQDSYRIEAKYKSPLIAPLRAGTEIGTLEVVISGADTLRFPLYVGTDVEKLGLFKATIVKMQHHLLGKL